VITESDAYGGRQRAVPQLVRAALIAFAITAAGSLAVPAQAAPPARNPQPGVRLIWATRTAVRIGWPAVRGTGSYSCRLDQLNGTQVGARSGPGYIHTVTFAGLHPGWRYLFTVRGSLAGGRGWRAALSVTLPGHVPPREHAYRWAEAHAGARYVYGAEGNGAYDCSGLVRTAYRHAGIWLPRTTVQMLQYRKLRRESTPRQGDLVFFGTGHVELYDRQDWSFGAESGTSSQQGRSWWNRWWPGNWWPTAFYRVQ
jgi:cell wall-associated NlpC family hydrolase